MAGAILTVTDAGLYCAEGGFHIDPLRPVDRAVITHAHADHARPGNGSYLATPETARLLRARLGAQTAVQELAYGEVLSLGAVRLSFHPAGHLLGSAQVRIERRGAVWVATGDFKRDPDPTCAPFEPLLCHALVIESTFGLPVFRWPEPAEELAAIDRWWRENAAAGRPSLLFAYALGKAERVLAGLDAGTGPIVVHGAVEGMAAVYRAAGVRLPATRAAAEFDGRRELSRALVLAPPGAAGSPWIARFAAASRAMASGWMQIRGNRRRRGLDRGFVLSDHADWPALLRTVAESRAERVWITHGYAAELARFLREQGVAAEAVAAGRISGEEGA